MYITSELVFIYKLMFIYKSLYIYITDLYIYIYVYPPAYLTFPFGYLINISNLVHQKVNFNPPSLAPRITCCHNLFSSVRLSRWHHSLPRYQSQKSSHSVSHISPSPHPSSCPGSFASQIHLKSHPYLFTFSTAVLVQASITT